METGGVNHSKCSSETSVGFKLLLIFKKISVDIDKNSLKSFVETWQNDFISAEADKNKIIVTGFIF